MLYRDTSREAWRQFAGDSATVDEKILAVLRAAGAEGATCDRIEQVTGLAHQTVSGNLRHLVERGEVAASTRDGKTRKGRRAKLWLLAVGRQAQAALPLRPPARRDQLKAMRRALDGLLDWALANRGGPNEFVSTYTYSGGDVPEEIAEALAVLGQRPGRPEAKVHPRRRR